jgi:predicted nuclease with TOPRIM domain
MIVAQGQLKSLEALAVQAAERLKEAAAEKRRLAEENARLKSEIARLRDELRRAEASGRLQARVKARLERLGKKLEWVI